MGSFWSNKGIGTFGAELIECSGTLELDIQFVRPTPTPPRLDQLFLCVTGGAVPHDYLSVPFYLLQCEVSGAV